MVCGPFRSIPVFCAAMANLFMGGHLAFAVDFQTSVFFNPCAHTAFQPFLFDYSMTFHTSF
jgi:hypothetical protein